MICSKRVYRFPSQTGRVFCSKRCWHKFMVGKNSPFYGKKHTKENLEKNRDKQLGKKLSEETKKKISIASIKNARYGNKNNLVM